MRQSSVIVFFLFAAFVVFITQRGELPTYLGLLIGGSGGTNLPNTAPTTTSSSSVTDTLSAVDKLIPFVSGG
jgi:Kef-type K+ transport system membrane component KefB